MNGLWIFILVILILSLITGFLIIGIPIAVAIYLMALAWQALLRRTLREDD